MRSVTLARIQGRTLIQGSCGRLRASLGTSSPANCRRLPSPTLPSKAPLPASLQGRFRVTRQLGQGISSSQIPFTGSKVLVTMALNSNTAMPTPVVEPAWLLENLGEVKVLDASWYMPAEKRNPLQEFQALRIPGAQFFDVNKISDPTSQHPHMLPTAEAFSRAASALGLSSSDRIVVYDGKGIFSAARAWWMFRAFGHDSVAVLDGGLPLWKSMGLPAEIAPSETAGEAHNASIEAVKAAYAGDAGTPGLTFKATLRKDLVLSIDQVLENVQSKGFQVIDARAAGRFQGTDPEPRPGLPSGHIPGSLNVPFPKVLAPDNTLLCPVAVEEAFREAGLEASSSTPVATSCGTGVTACILALALYRIGRKDVPVYDGSWTEWASTPNTPILSKQSV